MTRPGAREQAVSVTVRDPRYGAFTLLRIGFGVAPILFGVDKFFNWMVDWRTYLWSGFPDFFNLTPQQFMYVVGGIEIFAGLLVLFWPRFGAPLVAAWMAGIITNLVIVGVNEGEYWDIALRDFGLMIGAIALAMLAWSYRRPILTGTEHSPQRRRRRR
jgi:uncharacterized membrane protein YphA (DoxX/SURF4 family)